ncbi:MAG: ABC transporter permease [Planctomycetota bacterium]|jgi:ABC-2 type transport system permease protein|nr:ABC transporter permease [Planctomycetota bacterium]MDP6762148.1 ABC transporter permease [Planctomycetota bacterium]MDP6990602.1 ABC transporter permease [Planctomycetota bacterium]
MGHTRRGALLQSAGFFVVLETMLAAACLFWPSFRDNVDSLRAMTPLASLREIVDTLAQGGVDAYVCGQHFFKGCNTLGIAAAVLFAMGAVAGEYQRGTFEIWLSRPVSRRRLLAERYATGAFALVLPIFATSATIPWLLERVGETMDLGELMLCSVHESLFLLTIYSATFLLSSLSRRPMWIAMAMLGFTTLEFSLYLVKTVTHTSLFRLTDIDDFVGITTGGGLDWVVCGPLAAFSVAALAASQFAFARRVP